MLSGSSSDENESDSDSLSNNSGQVYNLLENTVNLDNDNEDWNASAVLSSDKSKLCYSTPMVRDPEFKYYSNNVDSFSTVHSNSDLYKTAVDYNKSENTEDMEISSSCNSSIVEHCQDFRTGQNNSVINEEDINETENTLTSVANSHEFSNDANKLNYHFSDMEISSSFNGSIIVEDCTVYQDFKSGRNNSVIDEEDINETENTLTCVANNHEFSNDGDKLNAKVINDDTVNKNNSNISLELKCSSDTTHQFKSNNPNEICITNDDGLNEIDNQISVCLNRTLLDENGYMENLLSTSDNELLKK